MHKLYQASHVDSKWESTFYSFPSNTSYSLRSSRFLSRSGRCGDWTSERKVCERRSTPGVSKKVGEKWEGGRLTPSPYCLFFHTLSQFSSRLRAFGKGKETAATQAILVRVQSSTSGETVGYWSTISRDALQTSFFLCKSKKRANDCTRATDQGATIYSQCSLANLYMLPLRWAR